MNENHGKKYKHTRQLLKIAKEHGNYTHQQIADKAGLKGKSTSLVSRWTTGKALATERQMGYFIKHYEHFLKRKMEHLFYSLRYTEGKVRISVCLATDSGMIKPRISV